MCFALLTCTPPNFGDDPSIPTGEPLTIAPLQPQMTAGGQIVFAADGGTPPYRYEIASGSGSLNATTGLYAAPDAPGSALIKATDVAGDSAQTAVVINPAALTLSPDSVSIVEGTYITITAHGGTPDYTGVISGGGELEITSATTWRFHADTPDEDPWVLTVTDESIPAIPPACADILVTPDLGILAISPSIITLTVGSTFQFSADRGTGPYTYAMESGVGSITPSGLYTASQVTPPDTPDVIQVTDVDEETATASVTVETLPLQISPTVLNLPFNAGHDFSVSGGQQPYVFSIYSGGGSGTIDPDTGVFTALTVAGTVVVQVDDSVSPTPSQATVHVYAPLAISPDPATVDAGATQQFTASGGIEGYTYSKVSGVGSINESGLYTAPSTPGTAVVKVTDSIGNVDQTTITVVDPAEWTPPITVDTGGVGQHASLALTGTGVPLIAYQDGDGLNLARWTGSSFTLETVQSGGDYPGQFASLALDSAGNPRISYYYSKGKHEGLGYASWIPSSWWPLKVPGEGNVGQYTSLALDPTDSYRPRVAFYDVVNADLRYATYNGTTWTTSLVHGTGSVGSFASLRLAPDGSPHIVYYDANGSLKYAWHTDDWYYDTVDTGGVGQYASLRLNGLYPHIAYYDAANGDLKYRYMNAGAWLPAETVDSAGDVGKFASLALDSMGYPRIAYYDVTNSSLKYASWNGLVWVIATIDNSANVGQYASLALDPVSGKMRIAYYDTAGKLKYIIQQ